MTISIQKKEKQIPFLVGGTKQTNHVATLNHSVNENTPCVFEANPPKLRSAHAQRLLPVLGSAAQMGYAVPGHCILGHNMNRSAKIRDRSIAHVIHLVLMRSFGLKVLCNSILMICFGLPLYVSTWVTLLETN